MTVRKIASTVAITVAAALFGAGCGGSADSETESPAATADGPTQVAIEAFQFMPDPVTVKVGDTVEWTNEDATIHSVTAGTRKQPDREAFDKAFGDGEKFSHEFTEAGTYEYYCDRHSGPGMTGKVVVQ